MDHRVHVAGPPPLRQPVPVITAAPSVEGSGAILGYLSRGVKPARGPFSFEPPREEFAPSSGAASVDLHLAGPAMSTLYYFRSSSGSGLHGFAGDRSGARLPPEDGPWRFVREVDPATGWTAAAEIDAVRAGIHANGFFLADTPGNIAFDEPPVRPGD